MDLAPVIGIDPGTTHSGWVVLSQRGTVEVAAASMPNHEVVDLLGRSPRERGYLIAIEWMSSFGMAVGGEVFETCRWIGRMQQAWHEPEAVALISRVEVKLQLCGTARAKDPNVRRALIDLYEPSGGGPCPQIGTARKRGPLYGVHMHAWSALAVAVVASGRAARAAASAVPAFMGETPLERLARPDFEERSRTRREELEAGFDSRWPGE